jgi:hypothetical protein
VRCGPGLAGALCGLSAPCALSAHLYVVTPRACRCSPSSSVLSRLFGALAGCWCSDGLFDAPPARLSSPGSPVIPQLGGGGGLPAFRRSPGFRCSPGLSKLSQGFEAFAFDFGGWVSLLYGYHVWSVPYLVLRDCMTPYKGCGELAEFPTFGSVQLLRRRVQLLGHIRYHLQKFTEEDITSASNAFPSF